MSPDLPPNRSDHNDHNQQDSSGPANPFHEQWETLAEQEAEQRNDDRPKKRTGNVVSKKHAPRHLAGRAGQKRREDSQSRDKSRDKNRLVAMALKKTLHVLEPLWREEEEAADS